VSDDLTLPPPPRPMGRYQPATRHGDLVFTAGMTPRRDGELVVRGTVGADVSLEEAKRAAGMAAANALAAAANAAGGVENIERLLRLTVYVAVTPGFEHLSAVADGASDVLAALLDGERAAAARSAIGVQMLPGGAPVEIELVATCTAGAAR
jgi:enamine deaminase RidA (YjgF/YER057c/UK114 family)